MKRITLAASDGFRLVMRDADELEQDIAEPVKVIVPARALEELGRVLGDDEDAKVEMTVTPNRSQVLFRAGDVLPGLTPDRRDSSRTCGTLSRRAGRLR